MDHDAVGRAKQPETGLTLWLFGLTAMALVFASLFALGLLVQSGILGTSLGLVGTAYVVILAGIGIAATAYVVTVGRKLGLLSSPRPSEAVRQVPAIPVGMVVAPMTRPRLPLPARPLPAAWPNRAMASARPARAAGPVRQARQVRPGVLQVRVASLRAPFWDSPRVPTLVHQLQGAGTFAPQPRRPTMPPALHPVAPTVMRPGQLVRQP